MPYSDLQDYLARLEKTGKLHWIEQQVDPAWEVSAITRHVFDRYGCMQLWGQVFTLDNHYRLS